MFERNTISPWTSVGDLDGDLQGHLGQVRFFKRKHPFLTPEPKRVEELQSGTTLVTLILNSIDYHLEINLTKSWGK